MRHDPENAIGALPLFPLCCTEDCWGRLCMFSSYMCQLHCLTCNPDGEGIE